MTYILSWTSLFLGIWNGNLLIILAAVLWFWFLNRHGKTDQVHEDVTGKCIPPYWNSMEERDGR